MTTKNLFLWNKGVVSGKLISPLWFSAKTYFEENGTTVNEWAWADPFIDELSIESLFEVCDKNPPDVFGFSVFVWSYLEVDDIAKQIKDRYPNCLIVYGGPQNDNKYSTDFFQKKPWVDLVVPGDVYGEPVITYILDNFNNLKHSEVPEVYFQKKGIQFKSANKLIKREFNWPKNIFEAQKEHFKFDTTNSLAIYEASRGCPYKCIYCDWGGGTYTKIIRKPLDTVFAELEFLSANKVESIFMADGNLGIFKEDIDIVKHVVELKKKYGYPKSLFVENAKNHLDRVLEIQELLMLNNLSYYYKISVQNPHEEIKNNIDRIDIPFDEHLAGVRKLKEKYDAPILIETITGLPGDSYQRTLESIDLFLSNDLEGLRPQIWNLLPESPAYSPEMRDKFKIKSKWFELYSHPFRYKKGFASDAGVNTISNKQIMLCENVIGTYSYTPKEWCDMYFVSALAGVSKTLGFDFIAKYLSDTHNKSLSFFYDFIFKNVIVNKKFNNAVLNEKLGSILPDLYKVVTDDNQTTIEFDIDPEFPLLLALHLYFTFLVLLYPASFFTAITDCLAEELGDENLKDLGTYLSNITIDIDYDPVVKRKFKTKFNWYSYLNNTKPLTEGSYEYTINDDKLKFVGSLNFDYSDYPDSTDYIQKIKQFFYHRVSNQTRKKYAQHIIEREL